jgi:hypothetical protein
MILAAGWAGTNPKKNVEPLSVGRCFAYIQLTLEKIFAKIHTSSRINLVSCSLLARRKALALGVPQAIAPLNRIPHPAFF